VSAWQGVQGVVNRACRASIVGRWGVATEARLTGGASGTREGPQAHRRGLRHTGRALGRLEVPKVESHFLEYI
jgi:hypothetical protein